MAASSLAILLDLDGTVVDSGPGILASCRAALHALGHPSDALDLRGLIGPPLEEVLAQVLARLGDDRVGPAVRAYRDHYGTQGLYKTAVYPGLVATLDELSAQGVKLYIATSKRRVFAERILEQLGLMDRFVGVHGSEADGAFDRKPELIAHVLQQHQLRAGRCLMVGDRRHDAEGARANGVPAVGVLWGYGDRDELLGAGVQHLVAQPAELVPIAQAHLRGPGPA